MSSLSSSSKLTKESDLWVNRFCALFGHTIQKEYTDDVVEDARKQIKDMIEASKSTDLRVLRETKSMLKTSEGQREELIAVIGTMMEKNSYKLAELEVSNQFIEEELNKKITVEKELKELQAKFNDITVKYDSLMLKVYDVDTDSIH